MDWSSIEFKMRLILLSGPIAVGKSHAAAALISRHQFQRISSSNYLRELLAADGREADRTSLQDLGDFLDVSTDYRWLIDNVAAPLFSQSVPENGRWLLDAVRKQRQVEHFKGTVADAHHVHLMASETTLRRRYEARRSGGDPTYDDAISHPNEQSARGLIGIADQIISVEGLSPEDIADSIINRG
jgi:adenylate kinase family enzyme